MPGRRHTAALTLALACGLARGTPAKLVGHWRFDEGKGRTVRDDSGNDNHGRIVGARWVDGVSGSGLEFTGEEDCYVEVPHSDSLSPTAAVTVTAWAKVYRCRTWHSCLVYKTGDARVVRGFGDRCYTLWATRGGLHLASTPEGRSSQVRADARGRHYPPNEFTHFAMVIDCARRRMTGYINGMMVAQVPYGGDRIRGGEGPLRLGGFWQSLRDQSGLTGVLDEVRIYSHALTAEEIQDDMTLGQSAVMAFDDFENRLKLKWDILHREPSRHSLDRKRGALTITAQAGAFSDSRNDYENLFLIDVPGDARERHQITTRVSDFQSVGGPLRAGLVCWADEDNFLAWTYGYQRGRNAFTVVHEIEGESRPIQDQLEQGLETVWLRITKRGERYTFSKSLDGETFDDVRAIAWTGPALARVGLFALGEPEADAPPVDVSFDFIEVAGRGAKAPHHPPGNGTK